MKVYTDGSYHKKYKLASFGFIVIDENDKEIYSSNGLVLDKEICEMRNVAGEIFGVYALMQYCAENNIKEIDIYYDYKGIEMWATTSKKAWKTNNKYTQYYRKTMLDYYDKGFKVRFHKVKSHSKDKYNDIADELAKKAFELVVN